MSLKIRVSEEEIERLDAEYREAFDEWAVQVRRLREVIAEGVSAKEAAARVSEAENGYRATRNRLADNMTQAACCE
jgi:hypothetical protein